MFCWTCSGHRLKHLGNHWSSLVSWKSQQFCLYTVYGSLYVPSSVLSTYHLRFCLCTVYSSVYVCLCMCSVCGSVLVSSMFCPYFFLLGQKKGQYIFEFKWTSTHIASKLGYFLHVCPYQLCSGPDPDPDPKTRWASYNVDAGQYHAARLKPHESCFTNKS